MLSVPPASQQVERCERSNFNHLVLDIVWFGLALAATSRFLSVYAIRIGASPADLGWISALPALVLLVSSALGTWWRRHFSTSVKALMLPGFGFRLVFLLPAFTPFLPMEWQPIYLLMSVTVPAIPQGLAGVSFIVMMREAIFERRMTPLLGWRSLMLNLGLAAGALGFGILLEKLPFPLNYQSMFVVAFAFAMLSLWHCSRVSILAPMPVTLTPTPAVEQTPAPTPQRSIWRSRAFGSIAFVTAVTHGAMFFLVPVTPLYLVERFGATEGFMAIFGMVELMAGAAASVIAPRMVSRMGTLGVIALGMAGTALAALVFAVAPSLSFTLIGAALSGGAWTAAASVGLVALLMTQSPADKMAEYSAGFNQVVGLSLFVFPLVGSLLADRGMYLPTLMILGALLRLLAVPLLEQGAIRRWWRRSAPRHKAASQAL